MSYSFINYMIFSFFFFQAEDGIRDIGVTGVQTCALPISPISRRRRAPQYDDLLHTVDLLQHGNNAVTRRRLEIGGLFPRLGEGVGGDRRLGIGRGSGRERG